ncbi:hypothetical protein IEQ34_004923 [Dendrobium chrysotoxum]|uniref:Uncharacterized protein n=1 Tax=Dendrobium chrysotoxum TaxID=161865 RepID=A0AAV7GSG7_DENCH|nr:hypothetical protein IEQ34_004923 [Dendrobium chrysotoxum]
MVSSSPGRAEKLPTPGFSHILRGKSGSRSRGQTSLCRSSPLFPSRNLSHGRAAAPSIDAGNDGEPSSPKVTCIGQVRIRKKNKASFRYDSKRNRTQSEQKKRGEREMRCCFIKKSLLLSVFRSRQSIWRKWSVKLRFKGNAGYRRGKERVEPAEAVPLPLNDLGEIVFHKSERGDEEDAEEYDESETRVFVPPKNALILMRCRSAPHNRSSSLATRFSAAGPLEDDSGKGEDEGVKGTESSPKEEEGDEEARCPSSRPLFLKRCNSEPAKKAARLVAPEASRCWQNGDDGNRRPAKSPSRLH